MVSMVFGDSTLENPNTKYECTFRVESNSFQLVRELGGLGVMEYVGLVWLLNS
jgi:hypothetical protein